MRFKPSTSTSISLVKHYIQQVTVPFGVPLKWFWYSTKQQRLSSVVIYESSFNKLFFTEVCHPTTEAFVEELNKLTMEKVNVQDFILVFVNLCRMRKVTSFVPWIPFFIRGVNKSCSKEAAFGLYTTHLATASLRKLEEEYYIYGYTQYNSTANALTE